MRYLKYRIGCVCLVGTVLLYVLAAHPHASVAGGFVETFSDDPVESGRFMLHDSPDDGWRFVYEQSTQTLLARYDTGLPTARLVRPLGLTLTQDDSFTFRVTFTINSAGFFADSDHIAQIAFGLMNTTTTGPDRVYGVDGAAFDLVSFDYFPNVTLFGGPSLGPTIINSDSGAGFFGAIDYEFGPETKYDPGDEFPSLDTIITADLDYDGDTHQATLRLRQADTPLAINNVGQSFLPGGQDGDPTTIVTNLTGVGFAVDAFGILLWRDFSAGYSTVIADVVLDSIEVCWPAFGDFDGDCDVDQDDFGLFQACRSGPSAPLASGCETCDADGDGDVDQEDFGALQVMLTGPR